MQLAGETPGPVEMLENLEAENEVEAAPRLEVVEVGVHGLHAGARRDLVDVERDAAFEPLETLEHPGLVRAHVEHRAARGNVHPRQSDDLPVVTELTTLAPVRR